MIDMEKGVIFKVHNSKRLERSVYIPMKPSHHQKFSSQKFLSPLLLLLKTTVFEDNYFYLESHSL